MFRFADKDQVLWPVELRQLDENGTEEAVTVFLRYQLLPREQLREREKQALARMAGHKGASLDDLTGLIEMAEAAAEREAGDTALLLKHVRGWKGLVDADDEPLDFSADRLQAMLEFDVYFKPIMAGLHAASRHGPSKNSKPGPGGTPVRDQA